MPNSRRAPPWQLSPRRWWAVLGRLWRELAKGHISLSAGGVAFFGFLSVFPALAAVSALYGIIFDPDDVARQMVALDGLIPSAALEILTRQASALSEATTHALSLGAVVALVLALWSATRGARGIIAATNVAYDVDEQRSFLRLNLVALGMTLAAVGFAVALLVLAAGVPFVLSKLGLDEVVSVVLTVARWPVLAAVLGVGTAFVYFVAPNRERPHWQWVSPGSLLATILLLAASGLFSVYVGHWGSYNETYGSLAAVAMLLLWLYIAGLVFLLGAELNAEVEREAGA